MNEYIGATAAETTDEKRKRLQRERTKRSRDKKKYGTSTANERISDVWLANSRHLSDENPALHGELETRHKEVEALEAEVDEIVEGVKNGLRADAPTTETADSKEIFPMPDLSFRDVKLDVSRNGVSNYREIESTIYAESKQSMPVDTEGQHYLRYGFRLRLQHETLQRIREAFVLYAVGTHDMNLDSSVVKEAIADTVAYNQFSPNPELKKLISESERLQKPAGSNDGSV